MAEQIFSFNLPDIGEGVVEGEVIEWLKKVGDSVKQDEPVVIVMTDKATVELPAPYPGVICKHYYKPGEIAFKDKPLYDIQLAAGSKNHAAAEKKSPKKPAERSAEKALAKNAADSPPRAVKNTCPREERQGAKALALPKVRQLAREMGIDIEGITGSGKHAEVTLSDLNGARQKEKVQPQLKLLEGDEEQPLIGIRGLMARKMDQRDIPQFSYFEPVDVTRLIQLRNSSKKIALEQGVNLSYMPFFIRALALTAAAYPQLNSSIDMQKNALIMHKQLNIGTAMATSQGLIVPVLKGVQQMGLKEIIDGYEALKGKALNGKLSSSDMKEATISLSNFGALGEGRWATPMISHPEVAILAIARIAKAPVVRNDEIVIRDMLTLSWSFDHRVIDGELAAKISNHFCKLLRDPALLL